MPDITRVNYFMELCKQGSYTKAAECLYISQPALSRQIRLLEQELGVTLIRHQQKKFQLTPEGEAFLRLATDFGQQVKQFEMASHHLKDHVSSVLRIGVFDDLSTSRLLAAVNDFYSFQPNVKVQFFSFPYQTQLLSELFNGGIDIAIGFRGELGNIPRTKYDVIVENYITIIISCRHRLWGRKSISPEELRFEHVYIPIQELDPNSFLATTNFLQKFDVFLQRTHFSKGLEEQLLQVSRGDCVALSHMYGGDLVSYMSDTFARIPIEGSNIQVGDLAVAYLEQTQEIETLIECLRTNFL